MTTTPQDHKAKKGTGHKFTVDGKSYTLPALTESAGSSIPGGVTMDLMMDPDNVQVQMSMAFHALQAAKPSDAAMAALRSLPTDKMLEIVGAWMGESSGSSD